MWCGAVELRRLIGRFGWGPPLLQPAYIWKEYAMLGWTLMFLVIAIIAGVLGFGGIAVASAGIAKILFLVFLVLFAVSLIAGLMRRA
jgi:uncharacterized membrane protein YtjA (UPF0391 family)